MTSDLQTIRVFIGSGEASLLERKTLIHSLHKYTQRNLDIYVLNGTHNSIELNDGEPYLAPMSLRIKYRNVTEFSLYRFLIPEICNYQGKAIYIDSDTICLSDIGDLFDTPMNGCDFLAKKDTYPGTDLWGLSVMLINCEKCRFDLEVILDEIDQGLYSLKEFTGMSQTFRSHHQYAIGELDPNWNIFDYWDKQTKLIHYTNLYTQPWKYPNHPYGKLWFEFFNEATASGYITKQDVEWSMVRSHVRRSLLKGNFSFMGRGICYVKHAIRLTKKVLKQPIQKMLKQSGLTTKSA
jgi:lipopolysaccharide biosynthesis glycosyltransferase